MIIKYQKYLIILLLSVINVSLSSTLIIYPNKWYIYLGILSLASIINSFSCILILGYKMIKSNTIKHRSIPKKYLYIIPCYNESEEELTNTINSIVFQQYINGDIRMMIIVCDGIVIGSNNTISTDTILKKILKIDDISEFYQYETWDSNNNIIYYYKGTYQYKLNTMPYILIIKQTNYGKRDSLVLVRKLCHNYNKYISSECKQQYIFTNDDTSMLIISTNTIYENFIKEINSRFYNIYMDKIDYIIGIDGDTIFDYNCSYELIQEIEKDPSIHGSVGYVDIMPEMNSLNPFVLYQYGEYMFSQCLRRHAQSNITNKVNCLSGCNQILRISEETCGNTILQKFNYLPKEEDNIFKHIRSYASEDRNHVGLFLSLYPYVKTTQTLSAISYTSVPTSIKVFMSQRRRWSLGANTNDMMLVYLPGINIFEKIASCVNVITYATTPFIFIATIMFIKSIITDMNILMLYLSIIMMIPFIYSIMIPIFIKQLTFKKAIYYYSSYIFFILIGSIVTLCIYFYSISCMDVFKWGKTRSINIDINENSIIENHDKKIYLDKLTYKYKSKTNDNESYDDGYNIDI